jgi:hypothetical protein
VPVVVAAAPVSFADATWQIRTGPGFGLWSDWLAVVVVVVGLVGLGD